MVFPGIGTVVNVVAVLVGSSVGLLLGARLPTRTRDTVTDALGLVTLLIGAPSAAEVGSAALADVVGSGAPVLIVLGALLLGGIGGSLLDIEGRLEGFGGWLRTRLGRRRSVARQHVPTKTQPARRSLDTFPRERSPPRLHPDVAARERFIEGFVTASLVFCVGPLTILGSLSDGLGRGADQLILKAALDGFASIAFAAALGAGVMASVVAIVAVQGSSRSSGCWLAARCLRRNSHPSATGGLLLLGVGLRLLQIKAVPVGNLLPALLVAPALVWMVAAFR